MNSPFRPKTEREIERRHEARDEAEELIKLIAAEFISDPMSVQCFDERIVERTKSVAKTLQELKHAKAFI